MNLADYLQEQGIRPSQFAEQIGLPASTITRILKDEARVPRPETIALIADATGGKVSLVDWYGSIGRAPEPERETAG